MGGISLDDFTSSVVDQEIVGQGCREARQLGHPEGPRAGQRAGRQAEAAALTLRQLDRRCGPLASAQRASIEALSFPLLEALAEALLEFQGPNDLTAWLLGNRA